MIYFAQPTDGGPIKIGVSVDVDDRRIELESHYGRRLTILATMPGGRDEERAIHERFAHLRLGQTEQFRPAANLMEFIGRPLLVGVNPDTVEKMRVVSTLSVKLRMSVIESARVVAALRGVTITDLISDLVESDLKRMEQEEIEKRARAGRRAPK